MSVHAQPCEAPKTDAAEQAHEFNVLLMYAGLVRWEFVAVAARLLDVFREGGSALPVDRYTSRCKPAV